MYEREKEGGNMINEQTNFGEEKEEDGEFKIFSFSLFCLKKYMNILLSLAFF